MSTETTKKKIKIDNGTEFARVYTDKEVDSKLTNKQDTLVSGTNIKTLNGQSILGSGDMPISGGGGGGVGVIELTDKNGTISSTQLGEINANPQNFTFKYNGKILLFTKADSTNYQYCNNITNSSDNSVTTKSTLLTITSSTGAYTIAEDVHNVVANSIHPANGGDLTNIQVGSKVYSIPSGGGGGESGEKKYRHLLYLELGNSSNIGYRAYINLEIINDKKDNYDSSSLSFLELGKYKNLLINGYFTGDNKYFIATSISNYKNNNLYLNGIIITTDDTSTKTYISTSVKDFNTISSISDNVVEL